MEGGYTRSERPDRTIDSVSLKDEALLTSGSYERFFEVEGKRYCHVIDPRCGYPVEGMLSATAIAPTATVSDALSTAFFVLGQEGTAQYCESHESVRAILVPEPELGADVQPICVGWEQI